ncbi:MULTISPECIES: RNA-guided endonuclease InsQ/TnpB family protein [unclassified Micromonospora]|uniref:RNA-guided endonuclease InsQ/TnpB family protein n=1 Tax=unclassified Micromonospora TaxID=2617518 RepID=UPI003A88181E
MKRAFRYRFHPTPGQAAELARRFGCVRLVYNMALAARTEAWAPRRQRVTYNATSAMLTAWKKTDDLAFLNDVSCVPLQQALRHLQTASTNLWAKRARYPTFKSPCDDRIEPAPASGAVVGVDAGLDSLFTLSSGEKIPNPRHERRDRDRLARAQRNLACKARGSANRAKARLTVARIHARIADRRRDHLHNSPPGSFVKPKRS